MPDKPLTHGAAPAAEREARALYEELLRCWNERSAGDFARCFSRNGNMVGFDGSPVDGQENIEEHVSRRIRGQPVGRGTVPKHAGSIPRPSGRSGSTNSRAQEGVGAAPI